MRWRNGQDWLGQGSGHVRHGRPCDHLQEGWYEIQTVSVRLAQIAVNMGRSDDRRGLRRILILPDYSRHGTDSTGRKSGACHFRVPERWMPFLVLIIIIGRCLIAGGLVSFAAQQTSDPLGDGTITNLSPLGDQEAVRLDEHGNKGMTHRGSKLPSSVVTSLNGAGNRSVTPFGTPTPPSRLTPAPLFPLQPKGMAMPYPQAPTPLGSPNGKRALNGHPGR